MALLIQELEWGRNNMQDYNVENIKLDSSAFEFVQKDKYIKDEKIETKKIGFFKDALIRFSRNKASVAAFVIIIVLVLFSIFGPIFASTSYNGTEYDSYRRYYVTLLPKNSWFSGSGFWDGTKSTSVNQNQYNKYYAIFVETSSSVGTAYNAKNPISKIKNSYMQNGVAYYDITYDSYYGLGMKAITVTAEEYKNIQQWQLDNNIQVLYPVTNVESSIPSIKSDANIWYQIDQRGNPVVTYENGDKTKPIFVNAYNTTANDGGYNSLRIAGDDGSYKVLQENISEETVEITYISTNTLIVHPVLSQIIKSINTYLVKNKGAVSDFMLVKDIVERNCDARQEEINVQIPMPLYLGLMGTVIGIIVGIGSIALGTSVNKGFSAFINNPSESIGLLMGGVAIAMFASFFGILLTCIASWLVKSAASQLESDKNEFYTWIQTELLPVLGGTENSLMRLQENLLKFNRSFSTNTTKLDKALQRVETSYENQIELMQTIQQLDVKRMATANISVLRELQACIPQLERFSQYMHSVNEYISHVNTLNDAINSQMNRTQLIERMGTFFELEVKDIEQRKAAISQAVGTVDDRLQQTLHSLQENADKSMQEMNETLIRKQNIFNKALDEQQEIFKRKIQENGNVLDELKKLDVVASAINEQSGKLDSELESLNALKTEIERIASNQDRKMNELIKAIENVSVEVSMPEASHQKPLLKIPRWMKYILMVFVILGIIVFLVMLVTFALIIFNKGGQ